MDKLLHVSPSPHIFSKDSTSIIMTDVIIALMPALFAGIYFFGYRAFVLTLLSVASAVAFEHLWNKALKKENSIGDLSAIVSGILLAFNLPVTAPLWLPVVGAMFMIIVVKMCFGGLGHNFMNPALGARAFLLASWPSFMTSFVAPGTKIPPFTTVEAVTSATPLATLEAVTSATQEVVRAGYLDLFLGNVGGCIGETSALALLIGGAYLLIRRIINWRIPVCFIGTVAILTALCGEDALFHVLAGGLMLGAIFMATDYTTSPIGKRSQIIYAVGCGIITVIIRLKGGYPEGVSYSILLMNILAPLLDKYVPEKTFAKAVKTK